MGAPLTKAELARELERYVLWQGETPGPLLGAMSPSGQPRAPSSADHSLPPKVAARPSEAQTSVQKGPPTASPRPPPSAGAELTLRTLDEIRAEMGDCKRCKLCQHRKQIVFGSGNPKAELMFVGEGPGEKEDLRGLPFVGPAGELLTKMIEAMGYTRDDVYIANVVKCRPPGNRNPEADEIEACEPFLKAQIRSVSPKAIVALGKFAAQTLLRDETPISRLRGKWAQYENTALMPTFHPAYLLRNPADKKLAWSDLQLVMAHFGRKPKS